MATRAALSAFARAVDVVTYEFENVDVAAVERLEAIVPVRPGAKALAVCQDRFAEKSFLRDLGIATARVRRRRRPARRSTGPSARSRFRRS